MSDQEQEFGAGLGLVDKLKLFAEWAPLIGRLQSLALAATPYDRARAIVSAAQWAAGKTATTVDDEAAAHIEAMLKTPEGRAFYEWFVAKIAGIAA